MPARSTRDSCDELKRLDQEIDGAALDRRHRLVDAAEAGDDDGADRRVERERLVEHVHAVRVGQAQVDDQRVVGEPTQPLDGVGAVQRLGDGKAVGLEAFDDDLPKVRFVFDDEDGRARTIDNTVCHDTSGERKVLSRGVGRPSLWAAAPTLTVLPICRPERRSTFSPGAKAGGRLAD